MAQATGHSGPCPSPPELGHDSSPCEGGQIGKDDYIVWLRDGGREATRTISYVIRDRYWGTVAPAITDLRIDERADAFMVTYAATCTKGDESFSYRVEIEGWNTGPVAMMDEAAFVRSAADPLAMDEGRNASSPLRLGPYAVARIRS